MRARGFVIALAVAAIIAAIVMSSGGDDDGGGGAISQGGSTQAQRDVPEGAVAISFAYSPEKEILLEPLIRQFNQEQQEVSVAPQVIASGEAQREIATGRLKPTVWSPASSLWGRLLEFEADRKIVADENPSIVRTPLVIAMWEPLARALGWPKRQVGFGEILRLATGNEGWAKYGRPEFGKFKLGHTNPDFSTSGLSAVAAEYFAVTGKREGLTEKDVTSERVRRRVRRIERSIVHYGDTTLFFADQLERYGPAFASAVAMEEATLVEYNRRKPDDTKLVGLYPREGTFFSDNPYFVLDAEWVTPEQREAAATFQTWLAEKITPELAARGGFRPGDPDVAPVAPIDAANGADPKQPRRVLQPPQPRVLARVKAAWREDRKPANVMVVVDVSGSMSEGGKLDQAKQGLRAFFKQISPRDRVGIITFSDEINEALPVSTFGENEQRIRQVVDDLFPGGETAVIDATKQGFEAVQKLDDETRINAVVALTDGEDNSSKTTPDELRGLLEDQSRSEGLAVRVFTIAYGGEANRDLLDGLATASGGKGFAGDPEGIESVYLSISSFF